MSNSTTAIPARKTPRSQLVLLAFLCAALLFGWLFRQDISDWLKLRGYAPPQPIAQLATDDTMTPYATKVFYVNHPSIDAKSTFSRNCNNRTEQTIVLGCYHGGQNGIYLLSVEDPRLNGVEEVTAAHEMLHAAYDRLSPNERARIDKLLQNYYDHQLTDNRIRETIDSYKKTEPNDLVNEMHSIFGTEVPNLPSELEAYYGRYFTNRQAVVTYATAYASEFTSRREQVQAYDRQLATLKQEIEAATAEITAEQRSLADSRARLDAARAAGDTDSYNAQVPGYNAAVRAYNAKIARTKALIDRYNAIVEQRNKIAVEVQQLAQAISGDTLPQN